MDTLAVPPSRHVLELAGVDLPSLPPPVVRVEAARETAVVLSRSRAPGLEVDLDRCRADRVPVVVRPSGGGAVVLAPGVVAGSVLAPAPAAPGFPEPYFRRFCAAVAAALAAVGAAGAELRGVSDLALGDRKVAGTALRLWRGRVLFQVAVLVDLDLALLERYLRAPSRAPAYRAGRAHRDFVITLRAAGCAAGAGEVAEALRAGLGATATSP